MDNNTNNWKEFTLGDVQEEHPRRVAKRSRKPLLVLLIVAVLAVAAVTAAVLLDRSGFDGLRRKVIYAKAVKDENGCASWIVTAATSRVILPRWRAALCLCPCTN